MGRRGEAGERERGGKAGGGSERPVGGRGGGEGREKKRPWEGRGAADNVNLASTCERSDGGGVGGGESRRGRGEARRGRRRPGDLEVKAREREGTRGRRPRGKRREASASGPRRAQVP